MSAVVNLDAERERRAYVPDHQPLELVETRFRTEVRPDRARLLSALLFDDPEDAA